MKNSLVSAYMDYCDFYRPNYFILENVRAFATMDNSDVLKTTMNRLLSMGYQCTFRIMQVRDAPLLKKCSFFEHCSKGL